MNEYTCLRDLLEFLLHPLLTRCVRGCLQGSLETKEYMLNELTKSLQITQEQVCVMAALLGNFLLPRSELHDLYKKINWTFPKESASSQRPTPAVDVSIKHN